MSKIQEIENALVAINEAKFQDFCNSFFFWKGYDFITSTGSVIGKEKTRKGTPDSYIPTNNDEYIFIEYTTQERLGEAKSFFEKLDKDIDHCFNEDKSKIKNNQIKKVILCFTEKLKVDEYDELRKKCNAKGADFESYGVDQLSRAALLYPGLGKILNINIDTQQILTPIDFVKEYERGKLATGLSNTLYFREDEVSNSVATLTNYDILILEGNAGVGKSRLALEVLRQFCEINPSYIATCISNKGCPIEEDIRIHIQTSKDYIIFIDDANRATKHFEFLVNLLKEERTGKVKIVVTVRDYALNTIESISSNFHYGKVKITPLTDKQIREILASDDFKITTTLYSDVIVRIAQGNPRLAIMAAKVALEKQDLSAFNEIPKIYDSYFDTVVKEIEGLGDVTFLKVLGIVSFFKTIGKEYRFNKEIFDAFKIQEEDFWEKIVILNQMELVDLFENEIVKISDQILGTYVFYKTFIRDGILDLSILIINFYDGQQKRFRDVIFPVTNTFGFIHVQEKINPSLNKAWDSFRLNEPLLLKFLSLFWVFQQEKVLAHIGEQITHLPQDPVDNYIFEKNKHDFVWDTDDKDYFSILKQFLKHPSENYQFALDLTFSYLEKQPYYLAEFVHYVKEELIFGKDDYRNGYFIQTILFDKIFHYITTKRNHKLFKGIFYNIVNTYLQTTFQKSEGVDRQMSFTIYTFPIPDSIPIKKFREKIWIFLFEDFLEEREKVVKAIETYTLKRDLWGTKEEDHRRTIWSYDFDFLLPFIKQNFNVESYFECRTAQKYFRELKKLGIGFDETLVQYFTNNRFDLSIKLNQNLINGKNKFDLVDNEDLKKEGGGRDWDAVEKLKENELIEYVSNFKLEDYIKLWHDLNEICEVEGDRLEWSFKVSFSQILQHLAIENAKTFLLLLKYIFDLKNVPEGYFQNYPNFLVKNALQSLNKDHYKLYEVIKKNNQKDALVWKFAFFHHLDERNVNSYYSKELFAAINRIQGRFSFFDSKLNFLSKYSNNTNVLDWIRGLFSKRIRNENINIFTKVVSILLKKVKKNEAQVFFGWDFISTQHEYFKSNIEMLKEVYKSNYQYDPHFDYDGKEIKTICEVSSTFITEFLESFYDSEFSRIGREMPVHNFRFVWDFENYKDIIDRLLDFAKEKHLVLMDWEHFANNFFASNGEDHTKKMLGYIKYFIEKNHNNKQAIQLIFNIISYSFVDKRLEFTKNFLEINQDPEVFRGISFFQNGSYSGSRIPIIEDRINFIESIENMIESMPNSDKLIQHRIIVKNEINSLKSEIQWERRRDFEDYFG
jgi:hypothetical protein